MAFCFFCLYKAINGIVVETKGASYAKNQLVCDHNMYSRVRIRTNLLASVLQVRSTTTRAKSAAGPQGIQKN